MVSWILLTLLSALTFAISDILGKKFLSKYDITPRQLMFEEHFLTLLIVLLFFFPFIDFYSFYKYHWLFILKALFLSIATLVYLNLLKKHDVSSVSPLMNLSPVFLIVLSTLLIGELITLTQLLGILVVISGTYILEVHKNHSHNEKPHKFHFKNLLNKPSSFFISVLIILISISLKSITDKILLSKGISIYTNLYFSALIIMIIISTYFIIKRRFFNRLKNMICQPQTFLLGLIKIIDTSLVLIAISNPLSKISLIVPLRRTSTMFSSLLGGLLFHEKHLKKTLFASSIMILGVFLIVI